VLLCLGITAGLTLGILVDYLVLRHGFKPAIVVIVLVTALVNFALLATDLDPNFVVLAVVAFSSTRFVARPLLTRLGVRREEGSASAQAHP